MNIIQLFKKQKPTRRECRPWISNSIFMKDKHFGIAYEVTISLEYDGSVCMYELDGAETSRCELVNLFGEDQIKKFETSTIRMLK